MHSYSFGPAYPFGRRADPTYFANVMEYRPFIKGVGCDSGDEPED